MTHSFTTIDDYFSKSFKDLESNSTEKGAQLLGSPLENLLHLRGGEYTIIFGMANSGKSCLMDQVMISASFNHGKRFAVASLERTPEQFYKDINFMLKSLYPSFSLQDRVEFCRNYLYCFGVEETLESKYRDHMFKILEHTINDYDCVVIDPFQSISYRENVYQHVALFNNFIVSLCNIHKKSVFLVTHPATTREGVKNIKDKLNGISMHDVAGGANFSNLCHNMLTVYRDIKHGDTYLKMLKIKRQECDPLEVPPIYRLQFCPTFRRFVSIENFE